MSIFQAAPGKVREGKVTDLLGKTFVSRPTLQVLDDWFITEAPAYLFGWHVYFDTDSVWMEIEELGDTANTLCNMDGGDN